MSTARIEYSGNLRTEAEHLRSGTKIVTDAPVDNQGKGEAFSPTDLVATALITCMVTTIGIKAHAINQPIGGITGEVEKIMASAPRRISALNVALHFSQRTYNKEEKRFLEETALNCPVAKSIHPDIKMNVTFSYE